MNTPHHIALAEYAVQSCVRSALDASSPGECLLLLRFALHWDAVYLAPHRPEEAAAHVCEA